MMTFPGAMTNSFHVPPLFTSKPIIRDDLETYSSELQDGTVEECLPFLNGSEHNGNVNQYGIPRLYKERHASFLHNQLGNLPPQFMAADSGRPWFFAWCLTGLMLLGEDVSQYAERMTATARSLQNPVGGFGGGFGQRSHLATSYATVVALVVVGGETAYDVIDRRTMWQWLCSIKQPDGGFQMAVGGEEDVRGAYCAAVIVSLLNLPLELPSDSPAYAAGRRSLFDGLAEWVRSCQTYEGGVSAMPGAEAHGAYAFCALGCLSILDSPYKSIPRYLDVPKLAKWLSARQYAPEGGFSGRTNKLVDGCYSHWVGGCWSLIEAAINGPPETEATYARGCKVHVTSMYSRNALIRYIMSCCQDCSNRGGLRDKPSRASDAYHTCCVLSGLSSAQYKWTICKSRTLESVIMTDKWSAAPYSEDEQIFNEKDRVSMAHPVYTIPQHKVDQAQTYYASKLGI